MWIIRRSEGIRWKIGFDLKNWELLWVSGIRRIRNRLCASISKSRGFFNQNSEFWKLVIHWEKPKYRNFSYIKGILDISKKGGYCSLDSTGVTWPTVSSQRISRDGDARYQFSLRSWVEGGATRHQTPSEFRIMETPSKIIRTPLLADIEGRRAIFMPFFRRVWLKIHTESIT